MMCSTISSGMDDATYVTFFKKTALRTSVYFCLFCVSKNRSTGFYDVLRDMVGHGRRNVRHFFQKNRSTNFCVLLSLLCFKKPLYGLLCTFVSFVFQKNLLYELLCTFVSFVFQKIRSTNFCVLLSLSCFKKIRSTGFYDVLRDVVHCPR